MARIVGVDLPKNKRGEIGLTYIYGIGRSPARKILEASIKKRSEDCKIVKRKGKLYVICKKNPKFKMRQG